MINDSEESRRAAEQFNAEAPATPTIEVIATSELSEHDDDGYEHRKETIVLRVGDISDKALDEEIEDRYPPEHCQHVYDCCGQWYQNRPRIERHGKIAIVTLNYTQNI